MADPKSVKFQFAHNGLITKEDPSLLRDGQYRNLVNVEALLEGSLASRSGRKALGSMPGGNVLVYEIRKMLLQGGEDPSAPSVNLRYIGVESGAPNLWRTTDYVTFTQVAASINTFIGQSSKGFSLAPYSVGNSGGPWGFIASELKMLKDRGSAPYGTLPAWGILPASGVALAADAGGGNLDGGDGSSPAESTAYDYRFTYIETDTNDEGNPSITMVTDNGATQAGFGGDGFSYTGQPIAVHLKQVKILVQGTGIANIGTLKIYRRGGVFTDSAWRLIGSVDNPGSGAQAAFVDNAADADIVSAPTLETDNDPPVPSRPPAPITGSLAAIGTCGRQNVSLTLGTLAGVQPGTLLHLYYDHPEDVIIEAVLSNTSFTAYFQHTHAANADFEIDTITGQPAPIAITYAQFLLVAGDPNNPHLIYRSKGDQPQAFSILPADGSIAVAAAGSPANGILDMVEFRGQILTLNRYSLFETVILQGSIVTPVQVANRGPVGKRAWCLTPWGEVWMVTTDGVWSWDGGSFRKRSDAINPIFSGERINDIDPIDKTAWDAVVVESVNSEVHVIYSDIQGHRRRIICEQSFNDRWRQYDIAAPAIVMLRTELDTGSMIEARTGITAGFAIYDQKVIAGGNNYTSDYYTTDPTTQGNPIPFGVRLPWFDFGQPHTKKLLSEVFLDLDITGNTQVAANLNIDILVDYSDVSVETIAVHLPITGRSLLSLIPGQAGSDPNPIQSYGREARAFSYYIYGQAYPSRMQFFSLLFRYLDTGEQSAGGAGDWTSLGSKYDKKLHQFTVEFDSQGADQTIVMDTITGREGKTYTPSVQSFVLSNPTILGSGRALKTFPVADGTIVKEVRLRTVVDSTKDVAASLMFRILTVDFESEPYPPDVVSFSDWDDGGYEYDKYCSQIDLLVNTNGVQVLVQVQVDGTDFAHTVFTFTCTTTDASRRFNVTMPPNIKGKNWRIYVDPKQPTLYGDPSGTPPVPPGAGLFQLFSKKGIFKFQKADLGEVAHTFDWDELGTPYDKKLYTVTLRWDNTDGSAVTMVLDLLGGVSGGTVQPAVATFTLPFHSGRSEKTFPLPDGLVAKAIRLYPQGTILPGALKVWKYEFQKEDYPPDVVSFTAWDDGGSQYDKYANQIDLEVNTNNVPVNFQIQADGATVGPTLTVQSTDSYRRRNFTLPTGLKGKQWRIIVDSSQAAIAAGGGMFQLFRHTFIFQPADLGPVLHTGDWDNLGHPWDKKLYSVTLEWDNTGGSAVTMQMDTLGGVGGQVQTAAVGQFTLNGPRGRKVFPLSSGPIAKMVRIYPVTVPPTSFKQWRYFIEKEDFPPDIVSITPWDDGGTPYAKYLNQVDIEADTNGVSVQVQVQADGITVATVPVQSTESDRRRNLTLPTALVGKKWRLFVDPAQAAISSGGGKFQLFGTAGLFRFQAADMGEVTHTRDWDDLGYPYDKKLYTVTLRWDNTGGADVTMVLDLLSGVSGGVQSLAVTTFVLAAGTGRSERTFPLPDGMVAKAVRIHPQAGALPTTMRLWKYDFQKEDYPADIVAFTPWEEGGYEYDKYLNQLDLDVNTNGSTVGFRVQADGSNIGPALTVQTTDGDRRRNITLPAGLRGKKWRLLIDPSQVALTTGGMFQLFSHSFRFQNADRGEVGHTFDWDDLGHPWDKYLISVTIEWDNTGNPDLTLQMDINDGSTITADVAEFTLSGGRSKKEFPLAANMVAKMIRIYPKGSPSIGFKQWKYTVQKEDYPPDTILSTPWRDASSPTDKNPSYLGLDMDTGGVACAVSLVNEGGTALAISHTGTATNRKKNYAVPVDQFGKMWRLLLAPGGGGKAQLFNWGFDRWHPWDNAAGDQPPEITLWTPWRDAGSPTDKNPSHLSIDMDTGGVPCAVSLVNETGVVATVSHTGSVTNTKKNYALPVDQFGKRWRLLITPGGGGKSQLYNWGFDRWHAWDNASMDEPPEVTLWTPWQDAASPEDKQPTNLIVDMDTANAACTVNLVNEAGAGGAFTHTGTTTDRKRIYPLAPDLIGKMWRLLLPPATKSQLYSWGFYRWQPWSLGAQDDPPPIVLSTPWTDFGYPYDKIARNLILTINTGGVDATIHLQTSEAGTVATFTVNTTYTSRRVVLPCPSDLIGKLWRLTGTPGGGGLLQLWDWNLENVKEPAAVTSWDSYEQTFGYKPWKLIKQVWWEYQCSQPVTLEIISDTGTYSVTLPAHATRATERFYPGTEFDAGLNKSKIYRLKLTSTAPFKFYMQGSGVEFIAVGADRHAGYQQMTFDEMMGIGEGANA